MKVGVLFICTGNLYWPFAQEAVRGAKQFLLPNHEKDFFIWSDMPKEIDLGMTVFETEHTHWPFPTLMRYHIFLQQEEILKGYDYLFYSDIDMRYVDTVGEEILGEGLTAAQHPMYALDKHLWPPYEPNPNSAAYIPRPGRVIVEPDGRSRFQPLYFAGGFQGGRTKDYLEAMRAMKRMIDHDFLMNYIPIWNDESIWNRYLFDYPPAVVLNPSYVCPDSLIKEYYEPIWGCSYQPKIITLTKKFTTSSEGAAEIRKQLEQFKPLQK